MTHRENKKPCIIYPESGAKQAWDIFVALMLVISCFWTPWEMCFNIEHNFSKALNAVIDTVFIIDMISIFFSAHTTEDFEIIDDHK